MGTYQDEIEERRLINFSELGIPILELGVLGVSVDVLVSGVSLGGGVDVLLAVLDNLGEDGAGDVRKRDSVSDAVVFDHVLDRLGLERNGLIDLERFAVGTLEDDLLRHSCGKGDDFDSKRQRERERARRTRR